ncbi:52 kDa repressor of the inhibitor of the protein kinase [Myotis lucifugus]|uniref:52 kDa repressor of the inhibitor of the protein kinase n=1 Tax=Myotis lucifugus TaxID=59463 RepID=UPI000CCC4DB2|nr:52 kDa repressor of the inhibitor of the protein kinase [Myotis lucifugus]
MICRTSPYRTVLRDNAIPTIFDLTSHLNNPHSRHRKRIKELSEDEIRTLKQKKNEETWIQAKKKGRIFFAELTKLLNRNKNIKRSTTPMLRTPIQKGVKNRMKTFYL